MNIDTFPPIPTCRLILLPSSLAIEMAVLEEREAVGRITQLHVPNTWPGEDWINALGTLIDMYSEHPDWCAWNRNIVHRESNTLIGSIGCIYPPNDDGTVTIGYYIVPDYRRHGYALEAARAYIQWLKEQQKVNLIKAQCLTNNVASIRILEQVGMKQTGLFDDEEGRKIQWELRVEENND